MPLAASSVTTSSMTAVSRIGSSSLGTLRVIGRKRVPRPPAGTTPYFTGLTLGSCACVIASGLRRSSLVDCDVERHELRRADGDAGDREERCAAIGRRVDVDPERPAVDEMAIDGRALLGEAKQLHEEFLGDDVGRANEALRLPTVIRLDVVGEDAGDLYVVDGHAVQ